MDFRPQVLQTFRHGRARQPDDPFHGSPAAFENPEPLAAGIPVRAQLIHNQPGPRPHGDVRIQPWEACRGYQRHIRQPRLLAGGQPLPDGHTQRLAGQLMVGRPLVQLPLPRVLADQLGGHHHQPLQVLPASPAQVHDRDARERLTQAHVEKQSAIRMLEREPDGGFLIVGQRTRHTRRVCVHPRGSGVSTGNPWVTRRHSTRVQKPSDPYDCNGSATIPTIRPPHHSTPVRGEGRIHGNNTTGKTGCRGCPPIGLPRHVTPAERIQ